MTPEERKFYTQHPHQTQSWCPPPDREQSNADKYARSYAWRKAHGLPLRPGAAR